jgi:DNA invertase Pin-like site-specific DNA recombinase
LSIPPRDQRPIARRDVEFARIPAAEYIRISTEHQYYSVEYQKAAIALYASTHNITVVKSYVDPGKSGLRIERRDGLRQLIDDVQNGQASFRTILVYDVSRWGRFQDADESAYYEFICKRAGVPVRYCAEQFENNGTLISQVLKGLKRAMAGEFSRELSVKVFEGQKRSVLRGAHQGGNPAFGFRRLLVDVSGNPRTLLAIGERKHFETDHVTLTPGPASEVKTVQRIFRLFVHSRMPRQHIAELLNKEGRLNSAGNLWTCNGVLRVLTNEKYIGNLIFGRTSKKLQGPKFHNPPKSWIRANGALKGIVDPELFASAQRILGNPWWHFTDNQLLDHLTVAFCRNGYLTSRILAKSKFTPAAVTYRQRFGSLSEAYRRIGYRQTLGYDYFKPTLLPTMHRNLIDHFIGIVERGGGKIQYEETSRTLRLNDRLNVAIVILAYSEPKSDLKGWTLRLHCFPKCELIIAARMDKANAKILDYHLLPRSVCARTILRFTAGNLAQFKPYRSKSLSTLCQRIRDDFEGHRSGLK